MTKDEIRAIFMAYGFTVKEGQTDDLKPVRVRGGRGVARRAQRRSNIRYELGYAQPQTTTLGEQIKQAEKEVANWTPERRANVRLQGSDLYAQSQPTTDDVLKVLTDLRRKLAALPHRQIELALGEYQAWMLKGDAFDLIDAEIERIERAGVKT